MFKLHVLSCFNILEFLKFLTRHYVLVFVLVLFIEGFTAFIFANLQTLQVGSLLPERKAPLLRFLVGIHFDNLKLSFWSNFPHFQLFFNFFKFETPDKKRFRSHESASFTVIWWLSSNPELFLTQTVNK